MELPDYPITRNEQYLSRIAGEDHPIPDYPITREEHYLAAIAEGGGGGGGLPPVSGSGKALVSVNGQWKQQEGFPYDEGETVTTLFDKTFSGFTYDEDSEEWSASVPFDGELPDEISNAKIYVDGEVDDNASYSYDWIDINGGNGYVSIDEDSHTATCVLYYYAYPEAPDSLSIKLDEVISGVHTMDGKLLFGENVQDGTALVNVGGEMTKQAGYPYREEGEETDLFDKTFEQNDFTETPVDYNDESCWRAIIWELDSYLFNYRNVHHISVDGVDIGDNFNVTDGIGWGSDGGEIEAYYDDKRLFISHPFDEVQYQYYYYCYLPVSEWPEPPEMLSINLSYIPVYIYTADFDYIPWSDAPAGTGLPEADWLDDGTYRLTAEVSDGEVSYDWQSAAGSELLYGVANADSWVPYGDNGAYMTAVELDGGNADRNYLADLVVSDPTDAETSMAEQANWAKIYYIEVSDGAATLFASELPDIDLNFVLREV